MTVTIDRVVGNARSLLNASLAPEFTLLDEDWNPGDPTLKMRDRPKLSRGSLLSVGLSTFSVLDAGSEATVVAGPDGSPVDATLPRGSVVYLRPRHTTWQVFSEVVATVNEINSPKHGLYRVVEEEYPVDVVDGTYVLSTPALKVLRVRYRRPGSTDEWNNAAWRFQSGAPLGPTVRTDGYVPGGTKVHIQYAATFAAPQSLDDTLESLNIPDGYQRLLAVGAARNLSLANESRRAQPFSQGDPRRAEEVSMTANVVVFDRLVRQFRDLVADARATLVQQHPYRSQMEAFKG